MLQLWNINWCLLGVISITYMYMHLPAGHPISIYPNYTYCADRDDERSRPAWYIIKCVLNFWTIKFDICFLKMWSGRDSNPCDMFRNGKTRIVADHRSLARYQLHHGGNWHPAAGCPGGVYAMVADTWQILILSRGLATRWEYNVVLY